MQCVVTAIVTNPTPKGQLYPAKQERLCRSLKPRFKGKILRWSEFPNNNYDKAYPWNIKAAACEEAMKQGYKQILWLDAPIVAVRDISPVFDLIKKHGYLTMQNGVWNCAQTVSDACLSYFNVSRDEAEKISECQSGIMGFDLNNPKGKALLEKFIQAHKDGAGNGSRFHDNQSSDPRFKFHRQDQSVLSLSSHVLNLPHIIPLNTGPVSLDPHQVHEDTVLVWKERKKHSLNKKNLTRRVKNKVNLTRKKGGGNKGGNESYIYFVGYGGLGDIISELVKVTEYAKKHKRSILFEMYTYNATDIKSVFDFTDYPVPFYTDKAKLKGLLDSSPLEPKVNLKKYTLYKYPYRSGDKPVKRNTPNSVPLSFDFKKEYPRDTILIRACGGGFELHKEIEFFRNLTFKPEIVTLYKKMLKKFKIPEEYVAAHLRATDKPLSYSFNISGLNKSTSNIIRKDGVDAFITKYAPFPTYVASDNKTLLDKLKKAHPTLLHGDAAYKPTKSANRRSLHRHGLYDEHIFIDAILELIILAKAKVLMTSVGGYSDIARQLWENKDVVTHLLGED
jgi:hypothetical protein